MQKLASLAGISARTLRYYDEFGILKPARQSSSGYRIYGRSEVDLLQQILFYRELGLSLENIKAIVTSPSFDGTKALKEHHDKLLEKRKQLDLLISNVEKTLADKEGRVSMSDTEKFAGFKQKLIDDNEQTYGKEVREKYGDDAVDRSNKQFLNMTEEQYKAIQKVEQEMFAALAEGMKNGDPAGEPAQRAAGLHRQWLTSHWGTYSPEAHAGVAQMYVDDERFTAYYDKHSPGLARFLRDAVLIYTGQRS
ncbi:DNA-binding transcriptional MerR regulator [Paenibacillus forsythiae]|uniref:DNA-binding transcriptional MerR regulator n=1 Tax=Paenibacillus forsythiae TaxID=365616 RepID=A0ABU3H8B8_9BACL|nr:MerR family transcriptional regulator [Paenibacillus forsythiae]MDT3427074.1 DNA-binding transcriptional MerR regulator [Paenibacillus forsythiae]